MNDQNSTPRAPDCLCIGAQKSATSWMYTTLKSVPGVFCPAIKEVSYFIEAQRASAQWVKAFRKEQVEREQLRIRKRGIAEQGVLESLAQLEYIDTDQVSDQWYKGIFGFAAAEDICCDLCPNYMSMVQEGIEHVMRMNPRVRILMIVRDPVDRAWSQIRMSTQLGRMDINFDRVDSSELLGQLHCMYDYAGLLPRWHKLVEQDRFYTVIYDQIQDDPQEVLNGVLGFLGLSGVDATSDLHQRINQGIEMPMPINVRAKLFKALKPQYEYLETAHPQYVQAWVKRHEQALG